MYPPTRYSGFFITSDVDKNSYRASCHTIDDYHQAKEGVAKGRGVNGFRSFMLHMYLAAAGLVGR